MVEEAAGATGPVELPNRIPSPAALERPPQLVTLSRDRRAVLVGTDHPVVALGCSDLKDSASMNHTERSTREDGVARPTTTLRARKSRSRPTDSRRSCSWAITSTSGSTENDESSPCETGSSNIEHNSGQLAFHSPTRSRREEELGMQPAVRSNGVWIAPPRHPSPGHIYATPARCANQFPHVPGGSGRYPMVVVEASRKIEQRLGPHPIMLGGVHA